MIRQHTTFALSFVWVSLFTLIWFPGQAQGQNTYRHVIYQDFRGKRPLIGEFKLIGPDRDEALIPEDGGLRMTLPKTRKSNQPTGVRLMFPLPGDFEVTATYEILAIDPPPSGIGVGVAFNLIAQQNNQRKMVKLGRFQLPQIGNVYVAECWNKDKPNDNPYLTMPTTAKAGQMRVIRAGAKVRLLVADEPIDEFREIYATEFTTEDLELVRIGVNTNGSPAGIDVRLVDVRIRYGDAKQAKVVATPALRPGPTWWTLGPNRRGEARY